MNKAFTLVESLVTIFIIAVLSLIILPNYYSTKQQLALQRSAFKLAQDIRRVQEMAMSAQEIEGEIPDGGYGISLSIGPSYTIFVDKDEDGKYDNPLEKVEDIPLEDGIEINSINPANLQAITIIFLPPDPEVFFADANGIDLGSGQISIVVSLISDGTKTKTINVNKAGLINIE